MRGDIRIPNPRLTSRLLLPILFAVVGCLFVGGITLGLRASDLLKMTGISCPADITVDADPDQCSAVVTYPPPTLSGGASGASCDPASGSRFPLGPTTVTCRATESGQPISCTFKITVRDSEPPHFNCPAPISAVAGTDCKIPVPDLITGFTVTDNCTSPGMLRIEQNPAPGTLVGLGTRTIKITATDAAGNHHSCDTPFTVIDRTPPVITPVADIDLTTDPGLCRKVVNYPTPSALDNCTTSIPVSCEPASGTTFTAGSHQVTCRASDAAGNTSSSRFSINIRDIEPPHIDCPADVSVFANSPTGISAIFGQPNATDNCGVQTRSCDTASGSIFPIGTKTVPCIATDAAGLTGRCTFNVTVQSPTFDTCARDDATGSYFRMVARVSQSNPFYGYWQFHLRLPGQEEIFFGFANSVKVSTFGPITLEDTVNTRYKLSGKLDPLEQLATVEVKRLSGGARFKITDTDYPNSCTRIRN